MEYQELSYRDEIEAMEELQIIEQDEQEAKEPVSIYEELGIILSI